MLPDEKVSYALVRSNRRTVSIQISRAGQITVRCPMRMSLADVEQFVQSKRSWIAKHLAKLASSPAYPPLTDADIQRLKKQARELICRRAAHFAPIVGVDYARIAIRAQKGRWGSCSTKGNLNFNCLLALVPPYVLDYIVTHELCHRKHPNHSPRFWAEVARVMPAYKSAEKWLKENGSGLIASLPK